MARVGIAGPYALRDALTAAPTAYGRAQESQWSCATETTAGATVNDSAFNDVLV